MAPSPPQAPAETSARVLAAHVLAPALAPLAITALAFTPVTLFGCVNRGWIAFGLALGSLLVAAYATAQAYRWRGSDRTRAMRWILTALLLLLPAMLLLGPLG